jgi:hypothetical protein
MVTVYMKAGVLEGMGKGFLLDPRMYLFPMMLTRIRNSSYLLTLKEELDIAEGPTLPCKIFFSFLDCCWNRFQKPVDSIMLDSYLWFYTL